jgi:hypothetical protein
MYIIGERINGMFKDVRAARAEVDELLKSEEQIEWVRANYR